MLIFFDKTQKSPRARCDPLAHKMQFAVSNLIDRAMTIEYIITIISSARVRVFAHNGAGGSARLTPRVASTLTGLIFPR